MKLRKILIGVVVYAIWFAFAFMLLEETSNGKYEPMPGMLDYADQE